MRDAPDTVLTVVDLHRVYDESDTHESGLRAVERAVLATMRRAPIAIDREAIEQAAREIANRCEWQSSDQEAGERLKVRWIGDCIEAVVRRHLEGMS